ncbi:MAG: SCO family protein [Saprospiraceae bacterium]|nr:SCO family protein [Saprospiraceae bacterium]MBK7221705.1 SCO family protein [Saprospiraceae bacterium]MBK7790281.1 SCO family protein [Saprospiraceae bacterium]MBK8112210.1 SCO family protein [Saprospiraceae bacterium]MBK8851448.1 SCO family protein [Saprospiraceae bacterium]
MGALKKSKLILGALTVLTLSCQPGTKGDKLPVLGNPVTENGVTKEHTIRPFTYFSQDSTVITNDSLANSIYIADFFFTSCPSICPRVMKQMLRLHDEFKNVNGVRLVSFTLDPKRDSIGKLSVYAENIGVKSDKWLFLTGDKDFTLDLADDFFVAALEDPSAPGGFDHSGKIILVDKKGRVRSFCEGTDPTTIPDFIKDVHALLNEESK